MRQPLTNIELWSKALAKYHRFNQSVRDLHPDWGADFMVGVAYGPTWYIEPLKKIGAGHWRLTVKNPKTKKWESEAV